MDESRSFRRTSEYFEINGTSQMRTTRFACPRIYDPPSSSVHEKRNTKARFRSSSKGDAEGIELIITQKNKHEPT